jgi:putative transposase
LLVHKRIEEFYMSRVRPPFAALMRSISHECHRSEIPVPHFRTIKRRLATYDPKEIMKARFGAKAAGETFRPVQANYQPTLPFQLLQIDHSPVDLIVVDERDRLPIGRPWITLAIDVATRVVAGFYLSLKSPDVLSVAIVLTRCVLPKETWLADRGLNSLAWPVCGIPDGIHMDNAKEFHSHALVRGAQEYGIEVNYRPVLPPHYGGHIERLIGTTMGAVHLLPGTTFSNVQEKGSYNSEKEATMTMAELEKWLALEIGRYHQSVHSSLRMPPLAAWEKGMRTRGPLRQVENAKQFFCDFLPGEHRMIRRDGIRLFNIHYMSDVLTAMAGRSGKAALIKYDPRDLSRVYLRDDDGHYWEIPYRDLRLPPISLWELQAATKQLLAEGRRAVDVKVLFQIAEEQQRLAEGAQISTRDRRAAERRRQDNGSLAEGSVIEQNRQTQDAEDGVAIEAFEVEECP